MYTIEQLRDIMVKAIAGRERHKHYRRTVDLAKYYRQILDGTNQGDLLVSYKPRETAEQKKQRVEITNTKTVYVGNKIKSIFNRPARVDTVLDNIEQEGEVTKGGRLERFKEKLEVFHRGQSLKDYLHEAHHFLNFVDPNAFIFLDFKIKNDEVIAVPVEYYSDQVFDYEEIDSELLWIIVKIGDDYTLHAPDVAISFTRDNDRLVPDSEHIAINENMYAVTVNDRTFSGITPVFKVGYLLDNQTNRETFVSIIEVARSPFNDLINSTSEYALSRALHGFLQKYQLARVCDYMEETPDGDAFQCKSGYIHYHDGKKSACPACSGFGLVVHKTSQDVILIQHGDKEEHIPLSEMVHYVKIPLEIIEGQRADIKVAIEEISTGIFGTQVFSGNEIEVEQKEAQVIFDAEKVNDVLYPFARNYSRLYKQIVEQYAIYDDIKNIIVNHEFGRDFDIETTHGLLALRKLAIEAAVPFTIIDNFDSKILVKQAQGDYDNIKWVSVWESYRPFRELTPNERMFMLGEMSPRDDKRVLFTYFDEIRRNIELETPNFYELTPQVREKLIMLKIDQYRPEEVADPTFEDNFEVDTE